MRGENPALGGQGHRLAIAADGGEVFLFLLSAGGAPVATVFLGQQGVTAFSVFVHVFRG